VVNRLRVAPNANTAYKWGHPERKDLPIPHWLRISIAIGAVVVAQGFVYHDSLKNLNTVIEEKRNVVSENWHLKHPDNSTPIASSPVAKSEPQSSTGSAPNGNLEIQRMLTKLSVKGSDIREKWRAVKGTPEEIQRPYAKQVHQWHAEIVGYLSTIPRGDGYLARLNGGLRTGSGGYTIGINPNLYDDWDLLASDLAILNDFIKDLGKP
jgi:hypothetical protein